MATVLTEERTATVAVVLPTAVLREIMSWWNSIVGHMTNKDNHSSAAVVVVVVVVTIIVL